MIRLKSLSLSVSLSKKKEKEILVDNEIKWNIPSFSRAFSRVISRIVVALVVVVRSPIRTVALKRHDRWRGGRKMSSNGAILGALIRRLTAEH